MSSRTFVCWDCRTSTRVTMGGSPRCRSCGGMLHELGWRTRIPAKRDVRGWTELRQSLEKQSQARANSAEELRVRTIHDVEREILKLEARPATPQRTRHIKQLRRRLEKLRQAPS
jgi:hypothetical protein